MEARLLLAERAERVTWSQLWGRDPILRRKAMKQVLYRMPLRPVWMFVVIYVLRLGDLDGKAGFHYSVMRSVYEYMIDLRIKELLLESTKESPQKTQKTQMIRFTKDTKRHNIAIPQKSTKDKN